MKKRLIPIAIILILCVSFSISQSYIFAGNMGWEQPRAPGDPMDGYWYLTDAEEGCFTDGAVSKIEDGKVFLILRGKELDGLTKLVRTERESYLQQDLEPGETDKFHFRDDGQALWSTKYEAIYAGKRSVTQESGPYLRTCDNPTNLGVFLSLFREVFDPDQPTITLTEMR